MAGNLGGQTKTRGFIIISTDCINAKPAIRLVDSNECGLVNSASPPLVCRQETYLYYQMLAWKWLNINC